MSLRLDKIDLTVKLEQEEYKQKLSKLQTRIRNLQMKCVKNNIPVVICFEGWDAGGKGGVIKRLIANMDPRYYSIVPISAPTKEELNHHYLWRFWKHLGNNKNWTIFDRSHYGRVLVERLEGFCSEEDWKRALSYEINDFETSLTNYGAIVIKFWLHISKEEQELRLNLRKDDVFKKWKFTDEDIRNRDKWDQYVIAVNDMLAKTNTDLAPWFVIPGNDKLYARIFVLETICEQIKINLQSIKNRERIIIRL